MTPPLSTALADRYEIIRELGRGGMATVYLARDVRHGRQVAIKVLHPELAAVLGAERFLGEIKTTANLQHPHILPLFDSGTADGQLFYVMPFIDGETLRARLDRETQLPIADAVQLAREVADALQYAHDRGVIHRDIKPENILLQSGHALVADFGIALAVQQAGGQRMTQTGLSLGTPQYMAPEQAMGEKAVDARADIYALGAVAYEMLAGEPPFTGPTPQAIVAKVMTSAPAPLSAARSSVSPAVEHAVLTALSKLPADRFANAGAFAAALSSTSPTNPLVTLHRASPHLDAPSVGRWKVLTGALALLSVTLAATVILTRSRDKDQSGETPIEFELTLPDSMSAEPEGSNASMALSPDGLTLVFQARGPSGAPMLYSRRLDERDVHPIRGTEGARAPAITPDGQDVTFTLTTGGNQALRRVNLRGGTARIVAPSVVGNVPVSWIDKEHFVFMRNDALWLGTGEQGQERLIAAPDSARNHVRYSFPSVLPGGTHVLVSIFKGLLRRDSSEIGVVSIADHRVQGLGVRGGNPHYARGRLFYVSQDGSAFAVPFDPTARVISGIPQLLVEGIRTSRGPGSAAAFTVAPTGSIAWLTGSVRGPSANVPVVVSNNGAIQRLSVTAAAFAHPRVSPNGQQVAVAILGESGTDIWRFGMRDGQLQRVTTNADSDRPEWMPDEERITYSRSRRDSVQLVLDLAAGAVSQPLFHVSGTVGTGHIGRPHGYGAFTVTTSRLDTDIWVVHADSLSSPRPLLKEAYGEVMPHISPDGQYLAYESGRTGQNQVYVRALADRTSEVKISASEGREPRWSRDGASLYYRTLDSMYVARLETSPTVTVVSRKALFSMQPFAHIPTRSAYDVLPGDRGLLLLMTVETDTTDIARIVVRTNAAGGKSSAPR